MDSYLRKPFQPEELFEMLGESLGLTYVYDHGELAGKGIAIAKSRIVGSPGSLPRDLVVAMQEAVAQGDMAHLTELISRAETVDSTLGRGLRTLASNYDYEKLSQWLGNTGGDNGKST